MRFRPPQSVSLWFLGACFGAVLTAPTEAAELDICYLSDPPEDARPAGYADGETPFSLIGQTLNALYIPRALCGFDVTRDRAFWRSYVVVNGCSPGSEAGQLVEEWLTDAPDAMQSQFNEARAKEPERVATLCAQFIDCSVPEIYDATGPGFFCPSLGQ
ncbi:MAG: hypothetical protein AAGC81_17525 [Pseudomonadota bacterium]